MKPLSKSETVFVAGHRGMVGSAVVRRLTALGYTKIITRPRETLDLKNQHDVRAFFATEKPNAVILAAAKVGGILANSQFPTEFLLENLQIECNVIEAAAQHSEHLLFLGSSCIYPKLAHQPIQENSLLTGPLEKTNEAYALAKIAGLKLCEYYNREHGKHFISAMPTNLYGPGDNFHPDQSHVIPGLMRRFHHAKETRQSSVVVWGSGTPLREFLHVDDLAEALVLLLEQYDSPETINVGTGQELTIKELAAKLKLIVGFDGSIEWDLTKPDGTPRKLLDVSRIRDLGWKPKVTLDEGLRQTYEWAFRVGAFNNDRKTV